MTVLCKLCQELVTLKLIFFDATMLSKVEVQDSNISASLGGFMGGAVIAKTKQYSGTDSIKLKYRTTNSSWAKMEAGDSVQKNTEVGTSR